MEFSIRRIWPGRWHQFSLKALLFAITVIAVLCGLVTTNYRYCMLQASIHEENEHWSYNAGYFPYRGFEPPNPERDKFSKERFEESEHHRHLKEAYLLAAWRPWYSLSIDRVAAKVDEWHAAELAEFFKKYPNPGDWAN